MSEQLFRYFLVFEFTIEDYGNKRRKKMNDEIELKTKITDLGVVRTIEKVLTGRIRKTDWGHISNMTLLDWKLFDN